MIHSSSLETAETRRLRAEFLNHVRARPDAVLKNARNLMANSDAASSPSKALALKARGPPPLAEANEFSGRPPSPSLANEVKFFVCNSTPQPGAADRISPSPKSIGRPPALVRSTPSTGPTLSLPAQSLGLSSSAELQATGISVKGPNSM